MFVCAPAVGSRHMLRQANVLLIDDDHSSEDVAWYLIESKSSAFCLHVSMTLLAVVRALLVHTGFWAAAFSRFDHSVVDKRGIRNAL